MRGLEYGSDLEMKKARLVFIWGVTTLLLVSPSWNPNNIGAKEYIPSDDQGPEFKDLADHFRDLLPASEKENYANTQLQLFVPVRNSDGIDTVIGSYKDINGTTWTNVMLTLSAELENGWKSYAGGGENVTLTPEMRLKIWNVKYYANDTLGNWNVSDVVKSSYNFLPRQEPSISPLILIGSVIGMIGICVVALVVWRKRRI